MSDDELAYAKEVWAACATLGFDTASARRLKTGLDRLGDAPSAEDLSRLLALATQVQRESVKWALEGGASGWPPVKA